MVISLEIVYSMYSISCRTPFNYPKVDKELHLTSEKALDDVIGPPAGAVILLGQKVFESICVLNPICVTERMRVHPQQTFNKYKANKCIK